MTQTSFRNRIFGPLLLGVCLLAITVPASAVYIYTLEPAPYSRYEGPVYQPGMLIGGTLITAKRIDDFSGNTISAQNIVSYHFTDGNRVYTEQNSIPISRTSFSQPSDYGWGHAVNLYERDTPYRNMLYRVEFDIIANPTDVGVGERTDVLRFRDDGITVLSNVACSGFKPSSPRYCEYWQEDEQSSSARAYATNRKWRDWFVEEEEIIVSLEEPVESEVHGGIGNLRGFALSELGIERVEVYINGRYVYDAPYGGLRADVADVYNEIDGAGDSGYSMAFGYSNLGPGEHEISVRAVTTTGNYKTDSSRFEVITFHKNFINSGDRVDADAVYTSTSEDELVIEAIEIDGVSYNLTLQWRVAEQGFEVVAIEELSP